MGRQLYLISAFRTPEQNESVGGAASSEHLNGNALDVRTIEMSDAEKVDFVEGVIKYGGIAFGFYEKEGFIHFDLGRPRTWGPIPTRYVSALRAGNIVPYNA